MNIADRPLMGNLGDQAVTFQELIEELARQGADLAPDAKVYVYSQDKPYVGELVEVVLRDELLCLAGE